MKVNVSVRSEQLNKEDVRALLQAIRDCEKANFPDKEIAITCVVPEMQVEDLTYVLESIKPPFAFRSMLKIKK